MRNAGAVSPKELMDLAKLDRHDFAALARRGVSG
jgi:hypothetical protein